MIEQKKKVSLKIFVRVLPFLLFASVSLYFFLYSSPEQLITLVGVENAYLLIFVIAFMGGVTTFSGIPYHLLLITLAISGLNPLFLGIAAACGVMVGDSTSYFLGYSSESIAPGKIKNFFKRLYAYTEHHPKLLALFCFLFGALTPFSNDFITISAGIAKYPFWKVMIPLGLGNLVFNISIAYLATHMYGFLQNFFL